MTLYGKGMGSGKYLAVGLSDDGRMGNDLVFTCLVGEKMVATYNRFGKANEVGVTGVDFENGEL